MQSLCKQSDFVPMEIIAPNQNDKATLTYHSDLFRDCHSLYQVSLNHFVLDETLLFGGKGIWSHDSHYFAMVNSKKEGKGAEYPVKHSLYLFDIKNEAYCILSTAQGEHFSNLRFENLLIVYGRSASSDLIPEFEVSIPSIKRWQPIQGIC